MLVTSIQANKQLKKLEEELRNLSEVEERSRNFFVSKGENPETLRPEYDFLETQFEMNNLLKRIRSIKHQINRFNVKTQVADSGMTIDEVLVYLPQLSLQVRKLKEMTLHLPMERVKKAYSNGIIDYEYNNYDIKDVKKLYEQKSEELSSLQNALDLVNSTVQFELNF